MHRRASASNLTCGGKRAFITILPVKFAEVELVRVLPATSFGQNILVVVVTQRSTELRVGHVCSAVPLAPQMCD